MSLTVPTPVAPSAPVKPTSKWSVLAVAGSAVFMVTLDIGIVNVTLPVLTREFAQPLVTMRWVTLGYQLCIAVLLMPASRLADFFGRRRVFLCGLVGFGIGSALCGLAPTVTALVGARIFQGISSAMVQANTGALTTAAFPADQRGRALGLVSSIVSMGLLSGPVVGGFITQYVGWRWALYVNLPISLSAVLLGLRLLPGHRGLLGQGRGLRRLESFDLRGALLFLVAVASLIIFLNRGPQSGWLSAPTLALVAVGLVATVLFLRVERRVLHPIVELGLFGNQGFRAAVVSGLLSHVAVVSVLLLIPFYVQFVLGYSVAQAGLVLMCLPATQSVLGPIGGVLSDRIGPKIVASTGLFLELVGMLSLVTLTEQASLLEVAPRVAILGAGAALFNSPNLSSMYQAVRPDQLGQASGWHPLIRNLGQSVGNAFAGALWTAAVGLAAGTGLAMAAPPVAMMAGFRTTFLASAAFLLGALLLSIFGRPARRPSTPGRKAS